MREWRCPAPQPPRSIAPSPGLFCATFCPEPPHRMKCQLTMAWPGSLHEPTGHLQIFFGKTFRCLTL